MLSLESIIPRTETAQRIRYLLAVSPVTALLGPRQSGKTWLARQMASNAPGNYFNALDFSDRIRLEDTNFRALDHLTGTVVIDEAQLLPRLFPKLLILADRPNRNASYLITGSASPHLIGQISESLAGRVRHVSLGGFTSEEVPANAWRRLWLRGGYPRAFLHATPDDSLDWRLDYITQFIERDLRLLTETRLTPEQIRRLIQMLVAAHGQHWNNSEAAQHLGISYKTVQRHVEIFKGAFLLRELPLYARNFGKRLKKAPKYFFRDSGLVHAVLSLKEERQLEAHPILGASWEGFCIEQILRMTRARDEECFTWSVQGGAEIDLLLQRPDGLYGFECKAADAPRRTSSMINAAKLLGLKKLWVVHSGEACYDLDETIRAVGFPSLAKELAGHFQHMPAGAS